MVSFLASLNSKAARLALVSVAPKACAPVTFSPWKSALVNARPRVAPGAAGQVDAGRNLATVYGGPLSAAPPRPPRPPALGYAMAVAVWKLAMVTTANFQTAT